jgi:alpha-N-acetylglucosaminidase
MALRGINLPLAWVGVEKILVEVLSEVGFTDEDILDFLSGPAFQAWNRFGNIQSSWGGPIPFSWIDDQFELQKKIVRRMVELGMTPVLPCFAGFVPRAITRLFPEANVVNGSKWDVFPPQLTNDTFLEPLDPLFGQLQKSFISKQMAAYGNISSIYTLDQYNENTPYSGDLDYLRNVTANTWKSLKAANPAAIWLMQGWLFYSGSAFWTSERIEAYLSGVEKNEDMLILDLYSESQPQWQRTQGYFGKPWIWCQLHDYGGSMGLYGQIMNVTINPIEALANSSNLVGFGLTPEGQEGNEIMYDLLLDQAWSEEPIDTETYFKNWVSSRYFSGSGQKQVPQELYSAWDILRTTVYNNTNLTAAEAVTRSIIEYPPSISGLVEETVFFVATTVNYNPSAVVNAWNLFRKAGVSQPSLYTNPTYQYDIVDVTRQLLSNAFIPLYEKLISAWENKQTSTVKTTSTALFSLLKTLDTVLSTNPHFSLSTWLEAAEKSASTQNNTIKEYFLYNARNQITLWGPTGEIDSYASKSWGGLVETFYLPRWSIFVDYLNEASPQQYNATVLGERLLEFELGWQWGNGTTSASTSTVLSTEGEVVDNKGTGPSLEDVLDEVYDQWKDILEGLD